MGIETEISQDIQDWGTSFELFINPVTPDDLVKTLVGHRVHDKALGQTQDPKSYGQGFQRHLIFTLIKLSARYMTPPRTSTGREFSPQLTWLLFEEPEAFLHPSQIDALDTSLRKIAQDENWQVSITTHSPEFVSKNVEDLSSLAKLCRQGAKTNVGQISSTTLASILSANQSDLPTWAESGIPVHADDLRLDMESVKYSLWLDPRRCSAFFANKVLLVEGPTECALIGYLLGIGQLTSPVGGVFILDTIGKFNIHRFMNLFGELGIPHAVLYDHDNGKYAEVDKTIQSAKNSYTLGVDSFPQDLETFLGIPSAGPSHRKPQHAMLLLGKGEIDSSKLSSLINKIATLLGI